VVRSTGYRRGRRRPQLRCARPPSQVEALSYVERIPSKRVIGHDRKEARQDHRYGRVAIGNRRYRAPHCSRNRYRHRCRDRRTARQPDQRCRCPRSRARSPRHLRLVGGTGGLPAPAGSVASDDAASPAAVRRDRIKAAVTARVEPHGSERQFDPAPDAGRATTRRREVPDPVGRPRGPGRRRRGTTHRLDDRSLARVVVRTSGSARRRGRIIRVLRPPLNVDHAEGWTLELVKAARMRLRTTATAALLALAVTVPMAGASPSPRGTLDSPRN
jgi:hypothetical protein